MYGMYYRDFGLNISCLLANLKLYDHFYMYHQNNNLPFIITLAFSIKQLEDMIGTFISAFIFSEKKIVTFVSAFSTPKHRMVRIIAFSLDLY